MRSYDLDFLIDGQPILAPDAEMPITLEDLDSSESGRDESGVMHRIVLREKVKKWTPSYSSLTREEYQYMDSLFRGKPTFEVRERALDGSEAVYTAYCSKMGISLYNRKTGMYKNLSFSIIEC